MRKTISSIVLISLGLMPAVAMAKSSKQENIGIGTGGIIGAAAGGPVGFIIGAAIGAKVGDTLHRKEQAIDTLTGSLDDSRTTIAGLQQDVRTLNTDIDTLDSELERMQRIARPELVSLLQAGIAMDLLFRTDEHVLADTTGSRLAGLGATLASMPDIRVQLDGFADERGAADYNQQLSEKRVNFVKEQLVASGVDPSRIGIAAHGEAPAEDDSIDSLALERRVSLTLFIENTPSVASNPD